MCDVCAAAAQHGSVAPRFDVTAAVAAAAATLASFPAPDHRATLIQLIDKWRKVGSYALMGEIEIPCNV